MPDEGRMTQLEAELERLKSKLSEQDDDDAIKDRQDQYRLSKVDFKLFNQEIHGNLKGLNADDHTQYLNNSRHDVTARHGDSILGNRTVDDTLAPTGDAGNLTALFSWLGYMVKAITGKTYWYTAPATTLEAAKEHIDDTDNPHSVTAAQVGALAKQSGSSLPAAAEGNRGQFFTVE
ncbi:MAG: hypothetical protein PHW65_06775, partial [Dehalococcoidales bacterium]|nr:hypothetical protein [Dehalococcoidales bacterium]